MFHQSSKQISLAIFVVLLAMSMGPFIAESQASLIGHWKFDERFGITAPDSAGGDNDGTLSGDVQWRPGAGWSGGALLYSSEDTMGRVEIPTTGMSASEGTIMAWGNLAEPFPTNRNDASYFFGHTTQPVYANRLQLYMNDNNTILDLGLGNSHSLRTDIVELQTESWYHVALTWDSGRYCVYVDGEELASGAYTGLNALHNFMDIGNDGNPISQNTEAFAGLLDEVRLYDHALTADEVQTAMNSEASLQACEPIPNDGASHSEIWVSLSWKPGDVAASHDVYFGENFDDVQAGTGGTFQGNQTSNHFSMGLPGDPYPDGLTVGTMYYWRVDEVEADGVTKHKGRIWSFFIPSSKAHNPVPTDGAKFVSTNVTLTWVAGLSTESHTVYFGDDIDNVAYSVGGIPQTHNQYYPGALEFDKTYYWRVDEFDGAVTHKGDVWSFTTIPADVLEPSAVPTFECLGLYWSPEDGSNYNVCQVQYRSYGSTDWREAMPLWYDDRGVGGYPAGYRGSIVNLEPGTTYEIELSLLNTGTIETFTANTWSEDFPIARTVYLEAGTTNQALRITESGSPEGYILYTHPEGESSTIDVSNQEDSCIYVSGSYIIIRGLTLREASVHGIRILNNVHDVVIEGCDISGWGRLQEGEWGYNLDAAVYSDSPNIKRIIVQRNKLHHPRADTNSWMESARTIPINTHHPMGPQAIVFKPRNERAGNYVIRYNEIYSDEDHYYNDSMGETNNFSYHGFPIRDTDIYGNYVANCWAEGIEVEGANCNVRVWGNYITRTTEKIATQSVSVGPLYIWRNVFGISRVGPNDNYGWRAIKSGDVEGWGGGKTYIFHNTILQPPPPDHGSSGGVNAHDAKLTNTCTRNNIFHVPSGGDSINSGSSSSTNDFNYDLYNGMLKVSANQEVHGILGIPTYVSSSGYDRTTNKGIFELSSSSPGYDAGVIIPNFNDNYNGAAPDIGAHEAGSPPMEFGVDAYQ